MVTEKSQQEQATAALVMLTAKASEGCTPCVEGYKRMAFNAGVSIKDIEFAIAIGNRTHESVVQKASPQALTKEDIQASQSDAKIEVVEGQEAENFYTQVLQDKNVQTLDTHFRSLGYIPVEDARGMARLQQGERTCIQTYLPYKLDDDRFGWIDYHTGKAGVDLIGAFADLTKQDYGNNRQMTFDSVIVEEEQVVPGHACNMNSFWSNLEICCGPAAVGCLTTGPAWWACAVTICGVCATIACFQAGCC